MEEELISFKTAKLAKEKGFAIDSSEPYKYYGEFINSNTNKNKDNLLWNDGCGDTINHGDACTQSLLQKWLREKHKIFITINCKGFIKGNGRRCIRWYNNISIRKNEYSSTYEKALEKGLQEALKLI